jgi:hypothetical protein
MGGAAATFNKKVKEVSQITYTVDADTRKVANIVRVVMRPPFLVDDFIEFFDKYGSVVAKIDAVDDDCHIWVNEDDGRCTEGSQADDTVLFVYLTPQNPDVTQAEVTEVLNKLKQIAKISG